MWCFYVIHINKASVNLVFYEIISSLANGILFFNLPSLMLANNCRTSMKNIKNFTHRCRLLQSLYREEIQEPMGRGPWRNSVTKQISMISNGEKSGKNFVNPETFHYATKRVEEIKENETINDFRLFNNLLSSQPMAFNLFYPLIQLRENGHQELVNTLICSVFPQLPIGQVTEIGLEFLHTEIKNYLNFHFRGTDNPTIFILYFIPFSKSDH